MTINHAEMVKALVKPGDDIAGQMTAEQADLWHGGTGVIGEAVEILEAILVANCRSAPIDRVNMVEELGDIEFYLEQVRSNIGVNRNAPVADLDTSDDDLDAFGTASVVVVTCGVLFDLIKKRVIYQKNVALSDFAAALVDIELALSALRAKYGITRQEALEGNIAKLSVRYAGLQYSDEAAQTRADKA